MFWSLKRSQPLSYALSAGAVKYADCTSAMRLPVGLGWRPVRCLDGTLVVELSLIRQQSGQWLATHHFGPYFVWQVVGLGLIQSISWSCQALAPIYFILTILLNLHLQQVPNPYLLSAGRRWLRVRCVENWNLYVSEAYLQLEYTGRVSPSQPRRMGDPHWFIPNTSWTPWWVV